jgi:hypothetical protein
VQKIDLFKMVASFGLVRAFRQLILVDRDFFQKNLENISLHAVQGGNHEIIRICEQEGYKFPHNESRYDGFSIAYGNSAMNVLGMFLDNFPDSSRSYSSLLEVLVRRFYDGPVTTSKTCFLLNVISRYCPVSPIYGGDRISVIYQDAVEQNIVPMMRYLVEMKKISPSITLSYALSGVYLPGRLLPSVLKLVNADVAKYFIEQGADIDTLIINFSGTIGFSVRHDATPLQLALANNDPEFAQFLRDEADRRRQLPKSDEEMPSE